MEYYNSSLVFFILRIMEFFSQFSLVLSILTLKINTKKVLTASVLFAMIFETVKIYIPQYLTSIVASIIAISIIIFLFKINVKKAILSYLITAIIVAIIDCIVCMFVLKICNLSSFEQLSQSNLLISIAKIIISSITLIIAHLLRSHKSKYNLYSTEYVKSNTVVINILITFFLLIPNLIMILYYHDNKTLPLIIILINIVAIIATFIINIFNTQRGIKLVQAEEEIITEKTYISTLQQLVDDLRTFKHDYDNTLNTINGYTFTEDWNGLRDFIKDVLKETKTITALNKLNPELFRNSSIFGLATAKFEYAKKSDVTMNFEIYANLDNMDIKTFDFTRTLGILLDNAIEASAGSEKKIVNFYVVEKNNKVTVEISNSFSDTGLRIEDITKKGVSSKGENRGLGLYKVKEIISKYPKIKHETISSNGMFLQRLIIDKINLPVS